MSRFTAVLFLGIAASSSSSFRPALEQHTASDSREPSPSEHLIPMSNPCSKRKGYGEESQDQESIPTAKKAMPSPGNLHRSPKSFNLLELADVVVEIESESPRFQNGNLSFCCVTECVGEVTELPFTDT